MSKERRALGGILDGIPSLEMIHDCQSMKYQFDPMRTAVFPRSFADADGLRNTLYFPHVGFCGRGCNICM